MDPISITMFVLMICIIITVAALLLLPGNQPFLIMLYSFYFIPAISILVFGVSAYFKWQWITEHKVASILFLLFLVFWLAGISYYMNGAFSK